MSSRLIAVATVAGVLAVGGVIYWAKSGSDSSGERHQRSHHVEGSGSAGTRLDDPTPTRERVAPRRPQALASEPAPTPAATPAPGGSGAPAADPAAAPAPPPPERAAAIEVLKK